MQMFKICLAIATFLPFIFFPLYSQLLHSPLTSIKVAFLFLATAHVATTGYFYWCREFRENIIVKNKMRYIFLPILLFLVAGFIYAYSPDFLKIYLLLFYWVWQSHHYGRQNIGVYSFWVKRPLKKLERQCITIGTLAGTFAALKIVGYATAPIFLHQLIDMMYHFGLFLAVSAFFLSAWTIFKGANPFLFVMSLFFVPAFLSNNIAISFYTYAIAHGLQYIIFMGAIALADSKKALIPFSIYMILGGAILYSSQWAGDSVWIQFFAGGVLGLTMGHFIVDAHAWRLSMPVQREFVLKRLT
ncbi:hypothetical protein NSTCB13_07510 [Nostoc sp. DSM 114160]|jgi:hypothetical protein